MIIRFLFTLKMWVLSTNCVKKQMTTFALSTSRRTATFVSSSHRTAPFTQTPFFRQSTLNSSPNKHKKSHYWKRNMPCFLSTLDNPPSEDSTATTTSNITSSLELSITNVEDLEDTGSILSINTNKGDIILLDGDLGAGKTCFARGFIRAKIHDFDSLVTSPTYLLSNTYVAEEENITIHHMDLYRLSDHATDFQPLNLPYVFQNCISLIEWPTKLTSSNCSDLIPSEYLDVQIKIHENDPNIRLVSLTPFGRKWESRIQYLIDEGYFDDLIVS